MEEQRDQVLADFQSCTGMEDVGECFMYLEQANWNLLDAIHRALPEETQSLPSEQTPVPSGPLNSMPRLLSVNVRYHDNTAQLMLPDSVTVGEVKSAIQCELGVAPCRQVLRGWRRNHVTDETVISTLELPADHTLQLSTTEEEIQPPVEEDNIKLNITDQTANKSYSINFPASRTLLQIKQDVSDLTSIPVRYQRWTGWPSHRDSASLRTVSQGQSELVLCVRRDSTPKKKHPVVDLVSSDSSPEEEEFEDASECLFQGRTHRPLMAEGTQDERAAIAQFTEEFKNRYGACHPVFMEGTLSEALEASCQRPCRERRPLAVYLHHDGSVLTNVFCTQLLCSEAIVTYLTLNFITWAWDLTLDSNRDRFLTSVTSSLGPAACLAIRNVAVDHLPALLVITRVRAATEVLTVIPGNVSLDELMTRLVHAVEVFNSELSTEMREEDEREARETVKREQDMAYVASLMADRAKEEARKQEEMEEKRQREMLFEQQQRKEVTTFTVTMIYGNTANWLSLLHAGYSAVASRAASARTFRREHRGREHHPCAPSHRGDGQPSFPGLFPPEHTHNLCGLPGLPSPRIQGVSQLAQKRRMYTIPNASDVAVQLCFPLQLSTMDPSQSLQQLQLYPKETITLEER